MNTRISLKERLRAKRLDELSTLIERIDRGLIVERAHADLIVEAIDADDLKKISAIIDKLRQIKRPELPALSKAIDQAMSDVNRYTAGGPIAKAWSKMKGLVGIDNPIVKVATFMNALEHGFSQIPQILKNNGVDLENADLNVSLIGHIARKSGTGKTGAVSDAELGNAFSKNRSNESVDRLNEADENEKKAMAIVKQLRAALAPEGVFGAFKKVPYVSGVDLASELAKAPLKVFSSIAKIVNSGAKTSDIAQDIKGIASQHGDAETKETGETEPSKPTEQPSQTAGPKPTTTSSKSTPTGETTPKADDGGAQEQIKRAYYSIKGSSVQEKHKISDRALLDIIKLLRAKGMFK